MCSFDLVRGTFTKPALIVGSGPSVLDLGASSCVQSKLSTIVVNGGVLHVKEPSFFFTADPGVLQFRYFEHVRNGSYPVVMNMREDFDSNAIGVERNRIIAYQRREGAPVMSQDDERLIYGTNSAHVAVHFAVVLGCSPIYLIGCDCQYKDGRKYGWELKGDNRGRHWTGARSMHIGWQTIQGKSVGEHEYAPGADGSRDGQLGLDIQTWKKIVDVNPHIDLVDLSGGALGRFMATSTLEEVLNA